MGWHGGGVVSQEHSIFLGRPGEDVWIRLPAQPAVLHAKDIDLGRTSEQSTEDAGIEVLVGQDSVSVAVRTRA
jgi:hypothetical protein